MLGPTHDAEDAFQAVFLALVLNPRAVRDRAALAAGLYGGAYRVCIKARRGKARSRRAVPPDRPGPADPLAELSARELVAILDDEVARLADRYRLPIVL